MVFKLVIRFYFFLKRMTLSMVSVLLGLDIIELDILESEEQRVEDRRADMVAKVIAKDSQYILHSETQNDNQTAQYLAGCCAI